MLVQAFLQRIANGNGRVEREYALGTGRTDLYIRWPYSGGTQKAVLELKILHKSLERTISEGLVQVSKYAQRCGAAEAHLLVFAKDSSTLPDNAWVFRREESFQGRLITIWGM